MKKLLFIFMSIILFSASAYAQPERIGAGLSFATKNLFHYGFTGNPGLNVRTWIALDPRKTMHIIPSFTAFNPLTVTVKPSWHATTYMFHGDLDFQYLILQEETVKLTAIAGINYTHVTEKSTGDPKYLAIYNPVDSSNSAYGPTIGASLEMRMSAFWDFILSARYSFTGIRAGDPALEERFIVAPLSVPVIQIHAVYYFVSRGKGYSRR